MTAEDAEAVAVNALRQQFRGSGLSEWDYAVIVVRTAAALAAHRNADLQEAVALVAGAAAALAPAAWPVLQMAAAAAESPLRQAFQEIGVVFTPARVPEEQGFTDDVLAVAREVEARRSATVSLRADEHVEVVTISYEVPFIPEIHIGLCLLNKVLMETAMDAFPGQATLVWEALQERVVLHFGSEVLVPEWRERVRKLWLQRLREIFSDQAEERFGPVSNVLVMTSAGSKRAPLDYVPRPLVPALGSSLLNALPKLMLARHAESAEMKVKLDEAADKTREWLTKTLSKAGYGEAKKALSPEQALQSNLVSHLVDGVRLGTSAILPATGVPARKLCIYCGGTVVHPIDAPEVAEGAGVKKFSKSWIASGSRHEANLCVRCSLASFLQLRRLGCYSSGLSVGPKRYFTVFHEGIYSRERLETLGRWANANYTLLREGDLIRKLGQQLGTRSARDEVADPDEDGEGKSGETALPEKEQLKRVGKLLADIQQQASDLKRYLENLRSELPVLQANAGISVEEIHRTADELENLQLADPAFLDTDTAKQVVGLVQQLLELDDRVGGGVAGPVVNAFRRGRQDTDTGIAVYELGGAATSRLVLLALPVLPRAKKGNEWIDLSRHFSMSRAAVTLTLGWLWRLYPGTYWWGTPITQDDGLIHTPYGVAGEREVKQLEAAWTLASQVVPRRSAEYPQLLAWAEKLVDDPVATMARVLRRQGDERPSIRRLKVDQLADLIGEVGARADQ